MLTPYDLASASPGTRLRTSLLIKTLKRHKLHDICECGCGVGILAKFASQKGIDIIGFDIHPQLVTQAAMNAQNARFFTGSIENMPFPDASIAGIVIGDVIEHLPNPLVTFREIARVLMVGGKAVMTIPNHTFEQICNLVHVSQADIGHQRTYSRYELQQLLSGTGLQIMTHQNVCNVSVAMADAVIAKLALVKYGKDTVRHSEMTLQVSSEGVLAWGYYFLCRLGYPVFYIFEYLLPSSLGTENLLVLVRTNNEQKHL